MLPRSKPPTWTMPANRRPITSPWMLDPYLPELQEILSICTSVMNDPSADRRLFVLHVDEGLMHPLYVVATYCRDSATRHQAFDLLRELPPGNGLRIWHGDVVIRTAKLIIDYEEDGGEDLCCADVPEWRRVHNASFDNWGMSSWQSHFGGPLRVRPNGIDGEWMDLHELVVPETVLMMDDLVIAPRTMPSNVGIIA